MRAVYDQKAQTIYIYVNEGKDVFSDEIVPDLVFADYNVNNDLIGIEIVGIEKLEDITKLVDIGEG